MQSCAPPAVQDLALLLNNVNIEDVRISDDTKLNIELKWVGVYTRDFTTRDY
jgi:hypothetical protein